MHRAASHESRELRALRRLLGPELAERMAAGGEVLSDAALRRWLRARRSPAAAAVSLAAHAAWRSTEFPAGGVLEVSVLFITTSLAVGVPFSPFGYFSTSSTLSSPKFCIPLESHPMFHSLPCPSPKVWHRGKKVLFG